MLTIKHLTGPLAGKIEKIDPALDRVMFGRRTNCEVSYPPEETLVSREHFALVRKPPGPDGHWTIELFGEPFVAVNGIPAEPGQKLPANAKFELGKHGGPSFEVILEPDATKDNLERTQPQEQDPGARKLVEQVRGSSGVTRRLALTGIGVAVVAAAAASYYYISEENSVVGADVRAKLLRSVFLVVTPNGILSTSFGTAFPISKNLLATNAHVAASASGLQQGEKMVVRSPGQKGKAYDVIGYKIHPGYQALTNFFNTDVLRSQNAELGGVPGYDVALLQVKEDLPDDTILTLASDDELRALNVGGPLAATGYPIEMIAGGGAQQFGGTPQFHDGTITQMTDFFFLPTDSAHRQLIQHSVPSAGGSSGSPIVTPRGHVVALLNAGNNTGKEGQRIANGVLINYAQRVDLLRHLIDGTATKEVADDRPYWQHQFNSLKSGLDYLTDIVTGELRNDQKDNGLRLTEVSNETTMLASSTRYTPVSLNPSQPAPTHRKYIGTVPITAGTDYAFIAYAPGGAPLQLWVYNGSQIIAHDGADTDKPNTEKFGRWVAFSAGSGATSVSVWIIGVDDVDASVQLRGLKIAMTRSG